MRERYCLVSDGDGHTWLCPVERREELRELLDACEEYFGSKSPPDEEPPPDPDSLPWLRRIDNPGRLTFTEPEEIP